MCSMSINIELRRQELFQLNNIENNQDTLRNVETRIGEIDEEIKKIQSSVFQRSSSLPNVQSDNRTLKLESIVQAAPWEHGTEPGSLPENWKRHQAEQNIIVDYCGGTVSIPKGSNYFTYQGKVAIGWHGSYNPPHGM